VFDCCTRKCGQDDHLFLYNVGAHSPYNDQSEAEIQLFKICLVQRMHCNLF
jgi:hypothetical protein